MKTKDNSFSGFPGCWNMVILVFFALEPNFWIILGIVIALTVSMFLPVEFVHPVRTKRWRLATLPIALLWTACAGLAAWVQFDPGPVVLTGLALSSVYLLLAGICMQLFPQNK
jgi:phosphatidylcholine synthase